MSVIETAFAWHGGKRSALYSFASTRQLWSEEHRDNVRTEIAQSIKWQEQNTEQTPGDLKTLRILRRAACCLPVGEVLPDPYA